jgi:hypothetical protein
LTSAGAVSTFTSGVSVTNAGPLPSTLLSTTSQSLRSSSTSLSAASATTAAPPSAPGRSLPNNAIAGVATGITAGAVLVILAVVYILRRRQQRMSTNAALGGKRGPGARGSNGGSIYPEIAYLYDPAGSGSASFIQTSSAENSRTALLPNSETRSSSIQSNCQSSGTDSDDGPLGPIGPTSPLLVAPLSSIHHFNDHDHEHDLDTSDHTTPITPNTPVLPPPPRYPSLRMPRLVASPSIPLPPPPPAPPPAPERALSPLFSPTQQQSRRESWTRNKNAWTTSPLLAPQTSANNGGSSGSNNSAGGTSGWTARDPQPRASRGPSWLSPAIMSDLQPRATPPQLRGTASHSKASAPARNPSASRPLTAIVDEEKSSP